MDFKNNAGLIVFFIFIAALAVRILYIFQILQFPLTEYLVKSSVFDQHTYNTSAIKILSGSWIGSEVFDKEPFYPYFLAVIYKIFGYSHVPVYIIQALLSSLGALCLYKITAAIFNRMTGYIAGFIFAFYSLSVYHDALILRESLIASLAIFLLYFIIKAEDENRLWQWFLSGAMLGFLMLTRRNMLLPFILFYMLLIKKPFKSAFRYALIFTAGFFIVILPVVVRNYVVSDCKYIGISKEVNAFWVGNNPASSGVDVDWSKEYNYLNDKAGGNINKTAAVFLNELKNNPGAYASLYLRKIWMFFNGYEAPSNTSYYLYREEFPTLLRWPLFNFQFICSMALVGILLVGTGQCPVPTMKPKLYILYIFLFVLSVSVILFHIQDRFRLPVVPFFIIFASYPFYFIIEKIRKREYVKPSAVIITFLSLFIILKPDLTYGGFRPEQDRIRPVDRTNLALAYMDEYIRRPDPDILEKALKQCDVALRTDNSPSIPHAIKGHIYNLQGVRQEDAILELKKALIHENRSPFLYNEISGIYYKSGDYSRALFFIDRALVLFPGNKIFEKNKSLIADKI